MKKLFRKLAGFFRRLRAESVVQRAGWIRTEVKGPHKHGWIRPKTQEIYMLETAHLSVRAEKAICLKDASPMEFRSLVAGSWFVLESDPVRPPMKKEGDYWRYIGGKNTFARKKEKVLCIPKQHWPKLLVWNEEILKVCRRLDAEAEEAAIAQSRIAAAELARIEAAAGK